MTEIKKMTPAEFRKLGYLQELNRQFLHPFGLALEMKQHDNGDESFGGIWDYRDDPEGIRYADEIIDDEFVRRAVELNQIWSKRAKIRHRLFGFIIQPFLKNVIPEE